jgi:hypothetical protein
MTRSLSASRVGSLRCPLDRPSQRDPRAGQNGVLLAPREGVDLG